MKDGAVLEMRGICKFFPGVRALENVDFTLRQGEIHALMGENGAGKSTLIKVLTGVYPKDGGEVWLSDTPVHIKSPQDAQNKGIATVYQEITLCPNLTVAENMYIGRTKSPFTNWAKINRQADKLLDELGIPVSATEQLGNCSIAIQQMVAIARAVDMDCKVLILDEPTSSLDEQEVQKLFNLMRDLKAKGVGIIFVTHFLEQVYEVCDRITVLRDGKLVGEYIIEDLPRVQLVSKMLGKDVVKSEEEFRQFIKDDIKKNFASESEYQFTQDLRSYVLNRIGKVEFPEELLKRFMKLRNAEKGEEYVEDNFEKTLPELLPVISSTCRFITLNRCRLRVPVSSSGTS